MQPPVIRTPSASELSRIPFRRQPVEASNQVTATTSHAPSFAWIPAESWAFGVRVWIAVVFAFAASFWLELHVPSIAAVTVAILALPAGAQVLEKPCFRLLATFIGVVAAIVITGVSSQETRCLPSSRDGLGFAFTAPDYWAETAPMRRC
jgi:hypothetical protein